MKEKALVILGSRRVIAQSPESMAQREALRSLCPRAGRSRRHLQQKTLAQSEGAGGGRARHSHCVRVLCVAGGAVALIIFTDR